MRKAIWAVLAISVAAPGAHAQTEAQVINDVAQALGGKARIQAVKTLTLEGEGADANLGQNVTPDGELPVWKVTGFQQIIDPGGGRMRVRELRTAQFLFALATVQRQDQGLDGDIAYNVSQNGVAMRASAEAARDRRIDMLHHPITIVRAALDPGAKVSNLRRRADLQLVDIITAKGDRLTLAVNSTTKLPLSVTSMSYNSNLGDIATETSFLDYEDVSGLKMPKHLITKVDEYPGFNLRVTKNTVDSAAGDLAAPGLVKTSPLPGAPVITVTAEPVAKGIWWLAGSGNHRSILFEFDDHLTLFEVPLNEARSKAVIEKARSVVPGKALTEAIVSHHHFDHSGGLRVAVAEGLTIITYTGNVAFFQQLAARKHSIVQDQLARNPRPLKIIPVDDELTLKDKSMEVRLYHLKDNPREGTNLFAYVPRDRILVQADLYDSTWTQYPWADNVVNNIALRKLHVDRDVPVHGVIESWADVLKTMQARGSGVTPADGPPASRNNTCYCLVAVSLAATPSLVAASGSRHLGPPERRICILIFLGQVAHFRTDRVQSGLHVLEHFALALREACECVRADRVGQSFVVGPHAIHLFQRIHGNQEQIDTIGSPGDDLVANDRYADIGLLVSVQQHLCACHEALVLAQSHAIVVNHHVAELGHGQRVCRHVTEIPAKNSRHGS